MVDNKKQFGSKGYLMKNDSLKGQYRINEQIRAKEVRIVSDEVEPMVYLSTKETSERTKSETGESERKGNTFRTSNG